MLFIALPHRRPFLQGTKAVISDLFKDVFTLQNMGTACLLLPRSVSLGVLLRHFGQAKPTLQNNWVGLALPKSRNSTNELSDGGSSTSMNPVIKRLLFRHDILESIVNGISSTLGKGLSDSKVKQ